MSTYYINGTNPDALQHYGVKGMKWGVRRSPQQLGHKSSKNINYIAHKSLSRKEVAELQANDSSLAKGTVMYGHSDSSWHKTNPSKSVTFTDKDIRAQAHDLTGNAIKYVANKDVKIAGTRTVLDTVMRTNKKFANSKIKDISPNAKNSKNFSEKELNSKVSDVYKKCKTPEQLNNFVTKMELSGCGKQLNSHASTALRETLKKSGYDAVVDTKSSAYGHTQMPLSILNDKAYTRSSAGTSASVYTKDELQHFGVKGMKWGVRRVSYKHKDESAIGRTKEKIKSDNAELAANIKKYNTKAAAKDFKASKKEGKALKAEYTARSRGAEKRAKKKQYKANKHKVKAMKLRNKAAKAQKLIDKNEKLMELYDKRLNDLPKEKLEAAKKKAAKEKANKTKKS